VRGLPQEKEQIQRARDDYQRALQYYQDVAPYGNSTAMITRVRTSLESVEFRLNEIEHGNSGPVGVIKKLLHIWQSREAGR
jgi:hypothetical protein